MTLPKTALLQRAKSFRLGAAILLTTLILFAAATTAPAQTFTKLYDFGANRGDPTQPDYGLAQGRDGNLYGSTLTGGNDQCLYYQGCGVLYRITTSGTMTVLHIFDETQFGQRQVGLTLGTDGSLYSTTEGGGSFDAGALFKMTTDGEITVLHSFTGGSDGGWPLSPPIQGSDGNLYGETAYTVYRMRRDGSFTTLYDFSGMNIEDLFGPLIQATDGNFYGATSREVFEMSPTGELTVLYHHPGVWCEFSSNVIQGTNGSFYGMINPYEGMCSELENAIAFTFNPGGPLTNLHTFEVADGYGVYVPIEATDGNLYGLAGAGGTNGSGTIYRLGPSGDFAVMYNFEDLNSFPSGMLVQHTNGLLYGVTRGGGKYRSGTVFSLDIGAAPFARPRARSAKILASSDKALPEPPASPSMGSPRPSM